MLFKGDLTKISPPELLMFLANLDKEGVLTVTHDQVSLHLSIREGCLCEAFSESADGKILRRLLFKGQIDRRQMTDITRMHEETGMPVIHILSKLKIIDQPQIKKEMQMAVQEVLLSFFLMEKGRFQFLNMVVDNDDFNVSCQGIVLDMASQVDEWREIEQGLSTLDRPVTCRLAKKSVAKVPYPARHILAASPGTTARQIVTNAPIQSFQALRLLAQMVSKKWLALGEPATGHAPKKKSAEDNQRLMSFKKAYKHILTPQGDQTRTELLASFCKYYFDLSAVLAVRNGSIVRCLTHEKDSGGNLSTKTVESLEVPVAEEPIIERVYRTREAFFGKLFSSEVLSSVLSLPQEGDCALLLTENRADEALFLFAVSKKGNGAQGAFEHLKMFSQLMGSPGEGIEVDHLEGESTDFLIDSLPDEPWVKEMAYAKKLAAQVGDLLPMPQVIARVLQLLADPKRSASELEAVLSDDQAIVARIIRISNSALYRGVKKVSNLKHALARLGTKELRSLVLTSSTRSLFSHGRSGSVWSRMLWQHAKECALAARCIAGHLNYPDPEEAFAGGLLHDVGKIVLLLKRPDDYRQVRKQRTAENQSSLDAEKAVLGVGHTLVGHLLMEKWQMPEILNACVLHHHRPQMAGDNENLARIISYGNCLSNLYGDQEAISADYYMNEIQDIRTYFKLTDARAKTLEDLVKEDFKFTTIFD